MIKPTIGRVVLVTRGNSPQPEPALICYVHSDTMINVGGFDKNGQPFSACSIQLIQDNETPINPSFYAEWMPYQKTQAAKDEKPDGRGNYAIGDKVTSITGAMKVGVTGVVEIIRSEKSVGVRLDNGDLWHEHSAHWAKA